MGNINNHNQKKLSPPGQQDVAGREFSEAEETREQIPDTNQQQPPDADAHQQPDEADSLLLDASQEVPFAARVSDEQALSDRLSDDQVFDSQEADEPLSDDQLLDDQLIEDQLLIEDDDQAGSKEVVEIVVVEDPASGGEVIEVKSKIADDEFILGGQELPDVEESLDHGGVESSSSLQEGKGSGPQQGVATADENDDFSETEIVGVRFEPTGKTYDYLQNGIDLRCGDYCIVEMDKGEEIARVFRLSSTRGKKQGRKPTKRVLRKATPQDLEQAKRNEEMGKKAQAICQKKIIERGLPMKLIKVKYSFDGSKAVFYFTAEGRIDFRDLVKDLAVRFRTRIEMRQIGVRDEARMISGFGCCGRQLCCSLFLRDFEPVSIRMAKDQCLTLNPGKISGICGRLMCCLVYEAATYEEIRKKLPKLGERVLLNNEEGKVVSFDILKGLVFVEFPDGRVLKAEGGAIQRINKGEQQKKTAKKSAKQNSGGKQAQ
ncbi:MAG: stage 0 sporulation family protein [bacterium]|nr:stage 0 sporulation family protein [bacterium]